MSEAGKASEHFNSRSTDGAKMCSNVAKIYSESWNHNPSLVVSMKRFQTKERIMRGVLLWLVGIPIPIIILLYLFNVV